MLGEAESFYLLQYVYDYEYFPEKCKKARNEVTLRPALALGTQGDSCTRENDARRQLHTLRIRPRSSYGPQSGQTVLHSSTVFLSLSTNP